jgi:hypothetical protein
MSDPTPTPYLTITSSGPPRLSPHCDACGLEVKHTVTVGEFEQWDSRTAALCRPCMEEALKLFPSPGPEAP